MKTSIITLYNKVLQFHKFVNFIILFTAAIIIAGCTGAGSGNAEVEGLQYGLRLTIIEGNNQLAKASETYVTPLKVKLSDTTGAPVQGVKIAFRQTSGADQATILSKTIVTSSEGTAETRIKAPDQYDSDFTIEAIIDETQLRTEFLLSTTPTGTPSKIIVQTSHAEIESAGVPFAYIFRLTDELNNTVKFNGTMTINFSVNTALKSWAGNEPILPNSAITCLFTEGICTTTSSYTLVDSSRKTYLTVSTGSLISEVNKEVTVLPSAEFQVVVANQIGGPAVSATAAGNYEGLTVLNTDMPGIEFHGAIVDIGGNYLRDADAADNIVWSAIKTNGTSYPEINPDLTPINGGGSVRYGLTKTVITPNVVRIRASKTGINSDDTGNIQVDPGAPAQLKVWTEHNQIENAGTDFRLQASILDAKGNLCTTSATKAGISGSGAGTLSILNAVFGSTPSIYATGFTGLGGSTPPLNFFNGTLIPLTYAVIPKGQKDPSAVPLKPTISMRVVMPVIELITPGFDLTGVTDPITVLPTAPRRLSFRSDTNNNGNYADDSPCMNMASQFYMYGDPTVFYSCLDATAGSASQNFYTVVEDKGGNPLKWNGTAWEMTDNNGTPEPVVIDSWNPNGSSLFNFSPVAATSHTVFNPVQAGYSSVVLKLNDPSKAINLTTTYPSLVSTGNVNTFFAETYDGAHGSSNLIAAPNSFTLHLVARDSTGNTVFGFNGTQSFSLSISPIPAASPKGTAANFPGTISANFVNGEAFVTGLKLPNATINNLTTFTGTASVNGDTKTTNTVNITVDVGSVDSLQIRNNANNAGTNITSATVVFSADTPPTIFVASYDSELNFYRDEVGTWSTSGAPLSTSISLLALAQSNPISPNYFCAGNNQGVISVTVDSRTVSTGQVSIIPGAYEQIIAAPYEISTNTTVTTVSAGTTYNLRIFATDQYLNQITSFSGSKNLTFTSSGNGTTRKGYSQTLPANASYSFVNGEVSPVPTFRLYNSSYTPRVVIDETTSVPAKNGQTAPLNVINDLPYNFYITRSTLYLNAGANAFFNVYLQDVWGNNITTGGKQTAQIRFYFDSTLGGTDILFTTLNSATINPATDEAIGTLTNGAAAFQVTAQKAGNLQPNAVQTSGILPNVNDINEIIVVPLTTVDQLQWVSGQTPQTSYTASKSIPFNEFKVEAVDIYGNRVTTDTSSINLSIINPTSGTTAGNIIGTATKSLDQGIINFTDFKYPRAHTMTIRAAHAATGKFTDQTVNVAAGLPNQALVILQGQTVVAGVATAAEAVLGSPTAQTVNTAYPVTIYMMDEVFNPVLTWGNSVSAGITDDSEANITPSSTNFVSGTATFTVTSHKQGSHQIIPNASSILNNLASSFFTVNPGAPTRLVAVFPQQTLNQGASSLATAITTGSALDKTAGVSFGVTVYATDNFFNIVADSATVVGLTLNNDSLATYGSSLPMVNGAVTFPNIRYIKALASSQIGLNVVSSPYTYSQIHGSSPFLVAANTATQTVSYLPSYQTLVTGQLTLANAVSGTIPSIKAGTNLTVRAAITDDYFNLVTSYVTPFTINLSDTNVATPSNITPSGGEAIFSGIQWITISGAATCQANASGLTNRSLSLFNVVPSDGRQTIAVLEGQTYSPGKTTLANAVTWTAGAQNRTAGVSYTVDVYLTDDYFNTITSATNTVGIAMTTDATAPAISTKSLVSGHANFNVMNTKADVNHTLRGSSGFTDNTSTAFTVLANTAFQTAVFLPGENYNPGYTSLAQAKTSAPNTQVAGTSFTATIRILDQYFNVVNTSGNFTLTMNDTNGVMTTNTNFTSGVGTAVITNYTANNANNLTLTGTGYATQYNSTTYIVVPESSRFLVTTLDGLGESIVAGKLTYAAAVSGTLSPVNADIGFNVSVSARDKYYNLINDNITVSIASPTDLFAILPAAKPLSNGIANFAIKNRKARYHYLTAAGTGYTSVNSNNYWVNWLVDANLVILLPGQTLNEGASALNINSSTHPNAITGNATAMSSGQSTNLSVYVTDQFFNQTDTTAGSYAYSLTYANDPYAAAPSAVSIVSATASFNYLPLRATSSQKVTPVLNTGSLTIYTTPFFAVAPGTLSKTEILLPNQTLVTGTTSRTVAIAYPASYTTTTDANFSVTAYALDAQHNQVTSANSTVSVKDQADANQATYNSTLVSGTATLSVEPVTPGSNHYFQVTNAPSITAAHAASDFYNINIGTPSKVLVQFPGQTFTPARRTGLQGLTGSITNQTAGTSFTTDVIVTDSKFNVVPVAWNINASFLTDSYGSITPSSFATTNGSATISVFNQVASSTHQIAVTPSSGPLFGVPFNSANYTALPGTAEQTILVLSGQTHTPGPSSMAAAVTGVATTVTAGNSTSATIKLVDHYFNVVNSNAAGVSLSDDIESAHVSPSTTSFSSGIANFTITPIRSGTHNTASVYAGVATHGGTSLSVVPAAATQTIAYFASQTYQNGVSTFAAAVSGTAPAITADDIVAVNVRVVDNYFNTVTSVNDTAALNTTDPVDTESSAAITSGVGSLTLSPVRASNWTMSAAVAGKTARNTNYSVTHGAAYQLVVKLPDQIFTPGQTLAASAVTPVSAADREAGTAFNANVYLTDGEFNVATTGSATINASWVNDANGLINTATPLVLSSGSGILNVTPKLAGTNHKVRVTPTVVLPAGANFDSSAFTVNPSAPARILAMLPGETFVEGSASYTGTPSAQTAGNAFNVRLRVTDAQYNTVSNYAATLDLNSTDFNFSSGASLNIVSGSPATGLISVLSNTKTASETANAWKFTPTSTNLTGITIHDSSYYAVNPNVTSKVFLALNTQTYSYNTTTHVYGVSGTAPAATAGVDYAVTAQATDAYNNPTADNSVQVGLATTFDSYAVIASPLNFSNGVAALTINHHKAGSTYTLTSTSNPALTSVTSSAYNVNPGSAYTIVGLLPGESIIAPGASSRAAAVSGTPTVQTAGTGFTFIVKIIDQFYNVITSAANNSKVISLILNNDNMATTPSNLNLTNGVASFSVTNKKAGSNLSITAATTGLTQNSDSSSIYTVQPGSVNYLLAMLPGESHTSASATLTGSPSTLTAGTNFALTVKAVDQFYNDVPTFAGAKALSFSSTAESSPNSTVPVLAANTNYTFTSGETTVNNFTLYKAATSSGTITVTMATPSLNTTTSAISVQPAATLASLKVKNAASNGGSEVTTVEYSTLDANPTFYSAGYDAYENYKSDVTSTWTAQRSVAGDLDSALSATSAASTQLNLSNAGPGLLSLKATGAGGVSDTTGTLTITEQGATQFVAELENAGTKTAGTAFNLRVTAIRSNSTSATSYAGVKTISLSSNASSGVSGCTSVNLNPELPASATFTTGVALIPIKLKKEQTGVQLTAGTSSVASSTTANFNVTAGALACLQIRTAASGTGTAITSTVNLSAFQNAFVYAHGYDANMNSVGDQAATWSSTGSIADYYSPTTGSSIYARVTGGKSSSGTLTATASGFSKQIDFAVNTGGATLSSASLDAYNKAHLLSNTIETSFMWTTTSDEYTAWKTNAATSWYNEAATNCTSLAHRGCQLGFPDRAIVTVTDQEISIVDAKTLDLYMRFVKGAGNLFSSNLTTAKSITARNGKLFVGFSNGLLVIDFDNDEAFKSKGTGHERAAQLALRNDNSAPWSANATYPTFANYNFKELKSYRDSGVDYLIAGLNQSIQIVKNNAGTVTLENGPSLTGNLTALALTSTGGIYFGESGVGLHFAQPNYAALGAFSTDSTKDVLTSQINSLRIEAGLSTAEASRDIIYMATQDGLIAMHDHSTPAQRVLYNYGLTSDGLTGFNSYLRHTSQTVSGGVSVADHGARPSTDTTVEFFFKPQTLVSGARPLSVLVDKAVTGSTNNDFRITLGTDSRITFYTYQSGASYSVTTANNVWNAHQWYHISAQINSAGRMSLWIDGTLESTINLSLTPALSNAAPLRLYSNSSYANGAQTDFSFDELRVSNSARYIFNAATISVPATPYANDGNTSYLLHFDSNSLVDSSTANAAVSVENGVHMVKPFLSGTERALTKVTAFSNGSAISGHVVSGNAGKLIELRNMQNPATMSENSVTNSSSTLNVDYFNKTSPTNFDFIQWNTGTGVILWAR